MYMLVKREMKVIWIDLERSQQFSLALHGCKAKENCWDRSKFIFIFKDTGPLEALPSSIVWLRSLDYVRASPQNTLLDKKSKNKNCSLCRLVKQKLFSILQTNDIFSKVNQTKYFFPRACCNNGYVSFYWLYW